MPPHYPNLFHFATSELSQDAFICWLADWANPAYQDNETYQANPLMQETGRFFIRQLMGMPDLAISKLVIRRQVLQVDVLILVNDDYVILIEDKTSGNPGEKQLEGYLSAITAEYPTRRVIPVFLKTADHGHYGEVKEAKYRSFLRKDFLEVLEFAHQKGCSNAILLDFRRNLVNLDKRSKMYQTAPYKDWQWHWDKSKPRPWDEWMGFYDAIYQEMKDGGWNYVSQFNGGFVAYHWNWTHISYQGVPFESYLQLDHDKLCIKLWNVPPDFRNKARSQYREVLYRLAEKEGIEVKKNGRVGQSMTVAAWDGQYIKLEPDGKVDLKATVEVLVRVTDLVKEVNLHFPK